MPWSVVEGEQRERIRRALAAGLWAPPSQPTGSNRAGDAEPDVHQATAAHTQDTGFALEARAPT